uniref:Uncharacterized protein n=1 Tax=Avena sativa TaxID=4498 RepID=A0ACD5V7R5_AVESA
MAGLIVGASTGVMKPLLGKLATLMGEEFSKLKNLRKEVRSISDELRSMNHFLERLSDVDELDNQTKGWRDEVREMSYDIEDIIDDFNQQISEKGENSGIVNSTIDRLKTVIARHRIASQIKDMKKLVIETSKRHKRYDHHIPPKSIVAIDQRVVTLYANAADLVGVEGPKNELVKQLKDRENHLKVVSIVGFGGLGKTTLANEVYRKLKEDFECDAFVSVSQKPNISKFLGSLLSQFGIEPSVHACESQLLDKLREYLQSKRYLIIIDDIWDVHAWRVIRCAFPENDLGSRVIATTRIQDVAKACCSHKRDHIFKMKSLSEEDSRRLFFGRIFGSEEACPRQLRDISAGILKKCGGLPLAVISISSMLATEGSNQKERWEHVCHSLGSRTNLSLEGVREILNLSYKDLPPHLKTCLLYIGMYPEDYIISRYNLERQWMAEGFINKESGQDVEIVARNYFNELVNRSLIQPVRFDNQGLVMSCRVHDMMLDLILLKSAEENFFTIVDDPQATTRPEYKIRRLSIRLDGASNGQTILPRNTSMSQVRSVMFFGNFRNIPLLREFKCLRVLFIDLDFGATVDLTELCKLYQLRYLWISDLCIYKIPAQIRVLQHLQTLGLFRCYSFPSDIFHLPSLMHLNVGTWVRLPDGLGNMKSLQHLERFDLEGNTLENIKGLGELIDLRYLRLEGEPCPSNKEEHMDALCSSLGKLCSIEILSVNIKGCIDGLLPSSPPLTPYCLQRLLSSECRFSRVPGWMRELHNLWALDCQVDKLLIDGVGILAELTALTHLSIEILTAPDERIILYGRGGFPALKIFNLQLSSPSYLSFQVGAMPKLQRLKLMFSARGWEQNGAAPAGVEHLLALEELSGEFNCFGVVESDKKSVESAFRSAIQGRRYG